MLVGTGLFFWSMDTKSKVVAAAGLLLMVAGVAVAMTAIMVAVNDM